MAITYSSDTRFALTYAPSAYFDTRPQPAWQYDILQLCLDGSLLEAAEIVDSFVSLIEACQAATELNARARAVGEPFTFVVQRHTPVEEPAAVEF